MSTPRTGQPGHGCQDPRPIHLHICGACGFQRSFSAAMCRDLERRIGVVPGCEVCGATDWRYEIDPPAAGPSTPGRQP